jgi:divalent metal cation (Fe/Co/Zn/Cd) transporter
MRDRDALAVHNERMKLLANTFNALAIGLIGFALLRPLVEDLSTLNVQSLWWVLTAIVFHLLSHYVLGRLEREDGHDSL